MNNSKWDKLLNHLTDVFDEVYILYKVVNQNEIKKSIFYSPDFKPFFIEPILYKEIEWILFPYEYELTIGKRDYRKSAKKSIKIFQKLKKRLTQ